MRYPDQPRTQSTFLLNTCSQYNKKTTACQAILWSVLLPRREASPLCHGPDRSRMTLLGNCRYQPGVVTEEEESNYPSRVAMACVAIASPRPMASTPSFVLALRLICSMRMPSAFASTARMAGKCGTSFGFSVITTASM